MGLSSNQARFLSLTSRQIDLEQRVQQICQRRLRLSSELENIATQYNNSISNRNLFVPNNFKNEKISLSNLQSAGYQVMNMQTKTLFGAHQLPVKSIDKSDTVTATAAEITATGANATMINLVNSTTGLEFVTHMTTQRQADGTYKLAPTTSIAISSDAAFKALMDNGFNNNEGLALNYILMDDMDMSGYNWNSIGDSTHAFSGTFDGNCHNISNMEIAANTGYQGMFANLSGTAKNISLDNTKIDINGGTSVIQNVGSIAGYTAGSGKILNCHSGNIDINIDTNASSGYDVLCVGGITGQVGSGGIVDLSSVTGKIDLTSINTYDETGGFIGKNQSAAVINMSYADVDITIPTGTPTPNGNCINVFMGCDASNGLVLNNCYGAGDLKFADGNYIPTNGTVNPGLGHNVNTQLINSWGNYNGTAKYWNGSTTNSNWSGASDTAGAGFASATAPNGANIWVNNGSTPPAINMEALNTFEYDGGTPTTDELEQGLRNGTYALVQEPDAYTQSTIRSYGSEYEVKDWRTAPQINDDLAKYDDAEAENKYDRTVAQVNSQDKKLQLEQSSIEVEYKAVSSEKEAVKKILDTNAAASFKYFG